MAFIVGLTALAAMNATMVPLQLEAQVGVAHTYTCRHAYTSGASCGTLGVRGRRRRRQRRARPRL